MIVMMIQDLAIRMEAWIEKIQDMFNKGLEELKNKQTEMSDTVTEIKNTLQRINSRIIESEEHISDLEDRTLEISAMEQNKEKIMKRNEDSLRDLRYTIKYTNM